jgi:alpha-mannosidase
MVPSTVTAAAEAFNHPLLHATLAANPAGTLPGEISFVTTGRRHAIVTGLKKAEEDDDLIVRFYEIDGASNGDPPKLCFDASSMKVVNFIEDVLEDADPTAPLRPHEIRTLKVKVGR